METSFFFFLAHKTLSLVPRLCALDDFVTFFSENVTPHNTQNGFKKSFFLGNKPVVARFVVCFCTVRMKKSLVLSTKTSILDK